MSPSSPRNNLSSNRARNLVAPQAESVDLARGGTAGLDDFNAEFEKVQNAKRVSSDYNIEAIRGNRVFPPDHFAQAESNHGVNARGKGIFSDTGSITSSITVVRDYGAAARERCEGDASKNEAPAHQQEDRGHHEEALRGISSRAEENTQTPLSLADQLALKLVTSVTDEAKFFLPASDLDEVIRYKTVKQYLKSADRSFFLDLDLGGDGSGFPSDQENWVEFLSQYICGDPSIKAPVELRAARRIFAILLLMGKERAIVDFLKEKVYDEDIPLVRMNKRGILFDLSRKGQKDPQPLNCFKSWTLNDILSFDSFQWYMKSPFFAMKNGRPAFYMLEDQTILPWRKIDKPVSATDFSIVRRVEIHPAHHEFFRDKETTGGGAFALKELKSHKKDDFDLEVGALKKIKPHRHLIELLTTFCHQGRYYLLLGWAEGGNLQDLWKNHHPEIRADMTWVLWLAEQCQGMAEGLRGIHYTGTSLHEPGGLKPSIPDDKNCGRHGDIKPQNVLWFKQESGAQGNYGVLKISDFGLTRFHSDITTKVSPNGVPVSQTYKAPEIDLNEDLSRPFDVWSLGCLYLEFITWMLTGWAGLYEFNQSRFAEQDIRKKFKMDLFYNLHRQQGAEGSSSTATVKIAVIERIKDLKAKPACSPFLSEFLDYIQSSMLVIDKTKRHTSNRVSQELEAMYEKCLKTPDYCFSYEYPEPEDHVMEAPSQADEEMAGTSFTSSDIPTFSIDLAEDDMADLVTSEQKRKRDPMDTDLHIIDRLDERRKRPNTYPQGREENGS